VPAFARRARGPVRRSHDSAPSDCLTPDSVIGLRVLLPCLPRSQCAHMLCSTGLGVAVGATQLTSGNIAVSAVPARTLRPLSRDVETPWPDVLLVDSGFCRVGRERDNQVLCVRVDPDRLQRRGTGQRPGQLRQRGAAKRRDHRVLLVQHGLSSERLCQCHVQQHRSLE
jgi:hypothetical protein